jgi:hypothetical protein
MAEYIKMLSQSAIFNKILKSDTEYSQIKDQNNVLKLILLSKNYDAKIKFGKYKIMENKEVFYRSQRLYHILLRFVNSCKTKKIKTYDIEWDLRMMPFEQTTKIYLVEGSKKYPFSIHDLLNIMSSSLLQQNNMFPQPQFPKNPYTTIDFRTNSLYKIYIKCLELKIKIPTVITYFAECDFILPDFVEMYKRILQDWAIDAYLSTDAVVSEPIVEDIYDLCYSHNISLHSEFPESLAYKILRPYLKLSYLNKQICYLMECFRLYNPYFGRKYQTADDKIYFDDRHLPFREIVGMSKNVKLFNRLNASKNKMNDIFCISLGPIKGVGYFDVENTEDLYDIEYDDDDEEDEYE